MFSQKMEGLGKKSSAIREIFEYSKARKQEIGEDKVFDFSIGNPSVPAPEKFTDTVLRLIGENDPVALHGYTSAAGDIGVRTVIANHITERFGTKAAASDIYMTCGAAASLTVTLKALAEEQDEVILLAPFFPEYTVFVENADMKPVNVLCNKDDFQIDLEAVEKAVNKNTKAIIINSPNNPTGAVFTEESLVALAGLLSEKSAQYDRPIFIIADEPYRELVYGDVNVPYIPNIYKNTVVCYSYSKSLSLPGERIGYIFVPQSVEGAVDLFAAVCGAGRSMGYVCAPSLMQLAMRECDGLVSDISIYDRNRTLLYESLTDMGYTAVKPDGAFYLFMKALEPDAAAFCERAKKYELLLVPSDSFGCEGYVRICYCVSKAQIERSLPAFKALIEEYNQ